MARQFRFQPLQQAVATATSGGMLDRPSAYQPPVQTTNTTASAAPVVEDRDLTTDEQESIDKGWESYKEENLGSAVIGGLDRELFLPTEAFPDIVSTLGEQGVTSGAHILRNTPDTPTVSAIKNWNNTKPYYTGGEEYYDMDGADGYSPRIHTPLEELDPVDVQNVLDVFHNYIAPGTASEDLINTAGGGVPANLATLGQDVNLPTSYNELQESDLPYLAEMKDTVNSIKDFYNKEQAIVDRWGEGTMYSPRKSDEVQDALKMAFGRPAAEIEKSYRDRAKEAVLSGLGISGGSGDQTKSMRDTLGGILSGR